MADSPLDSSSDARLRPDRRTIPGTPRWVKVFGIITVIVLALVVVLHVTGLVGMGGHHMWSDH